MIWDWIANTILKPVTSVVDGWQARKTAQLESELKISEAMTQAKIRHLETAQAAEIDWERTALETAGWKDEYLLIIFSIPLIMCFIPGLDNYVIAGFNALEFTPDWFQWSIGIMVAASYGYRKIADFMALKKGG